MSALVSPPAGRALQELVNRVSHRGGAALAIMGEAQVTLTQVMLMTRLDEGGALSVSQLAEGLNLSRPAASQAIERLVRLGLITRIEDPEDRRRKIVSLGPDGARLLGRLVDARTAEYSAALNRAPAALQAKLAAILVEVLESLAHDDPSGRSGEGG